MPRVASRRSRAAGASAGRGFTLVELLISITLTALLLLSVYATVRLAADGMHGVERSVRHSEQQRVLDRFVQHQLDHAVVDPRQSFVGRPLSMRFAVASADARTRLCRLFVRRIGTGQSLLASLSAVDGSGRAEPSVLGRALGRLRFSYYGNQQADDIPRWSEHWSAARLPSLVRMTVDDGVGTREWFFAVAGIDIAARDSRR